MVSCRLPGSPDPRRLLYQGVGHATHRDGWSSFRTRDRLHSEDFIGANDGGVTNYAIRGMSGGDHRLTMRTLELFKSPKEPLWSVT